jgi:hypothetical protein
LLESNIWYHLCWLAVANIKYLNFLVPFLMVLHKLIILLKYCYYFVLEL